MERLPPKKLFSAKLGRFSPAVIAGVVLLFLVTAGCGSARTAGDQTVARTGGELNYFLGEPVSIDPAYAQEGEGLQVVKQLFDGLVDYDPETLELKPAVATSWRSNPTGDEWTFFLREGVKFHNGREVTAADFIYAWNRVAAKKTASEVAYHLAPIKGFAQVQAGKESSLSGVTELGTYILRVKLNYPFAEFPMILGHPVFSPVPKEAVAKSDKRFGEQPIGNGPFAMDGPWRHQQTITLKRFPEYYGAGAFLSQVNFKIVNSEQTAFLQFKGGALDYSSIPSGQIKATVSQYGERSIVGRPQLALQFYGFNLNSAPFKNNAKLRQAISYAVDREVIADKIYEGAYLPAGGIIPPSMSGYQEPKGTHAYSIAKAKRLLKEAGHPGGKKLPTIKLIYVAGRGNEGPAQVFQQNMGDLGVNVKLEGLEFGAFLSALREGKMSMFAASWGADYPSRDAFLYQLFYSQSDDNVLGFADEKVDALLIKARQTVDADQRRRLYEQAESIILKEAPVVPLAYVGTNAVHSSRVKGFSRTALDDTPLDRVWLAR
jgi:oligopeptide transport system substrate-binding protein